MFVVISIRSDVRGNSGIITDNYIPITIHEYASPETGNDWSQSDESKKGSLHRRHNGSFITLSSNGQELGKQNSRFSWLIAMTERSSTQTPCKCTRV